MILPAALFLAAIALCAVSAGVETGFYRVTRVRLLLGALSGGRVDRAMLWLAHHPGLFVATTLIGATLASDLASIAAVWGAQAWAGDSHLAGILVPMLLTPVVFVYGELLPKHVFYLAPYRLLRATAPLFLAFAALVLPLSFLLWWISRLLGRLLGEEPETVRMTLAGRELQRLFEEGRQAGLLLPAQQNLAQSLFAAVEQSVGNVATAPHRLVRGRSDMSRDELLRLCRLRGVAWLPIEVAGAGEVLGYVRAIDLHLANEGAPLPLRPFLEISAAENKIAALMLLHDRHEDVARVVSAAGTTTGFVNLRQLSEPFFRGDAAV